MTMRATNVVQLPGAAKMNEFHSGKLEKWLDGQSAIRLQRALVMFGTPLMLAAGIGIFTFLVTVNNSLIKMQTVMEERVPDNLKMELESLRVQLKAMDTRVNILEADVRMLSRNPATRN